MKIKTNDEALQVGASPQKQAYKSPLLRVYGAVHQFTQGSAGSATDNMTMNTKM